LIGYEHININNSEFSLERGDPVKLKDPPKNGAEIKITLRNKIVKENQIELTINIFYISDITNSPVEESFDFPITLPNLMPENKNLKTEFGIATFRGFCFKPSSYEVCE
jgi:hypothetical protein